METSSKQTNATNINSNSNTDNSNNATVNKPDSNNDNITTSNTNNVSTATQQPPKTKKSVSPKPLTTSQQLPLSMSTTSAPSTPLNHPPELSSNTQLLAPPIPIAPHSAPSTPQLSSVSTIQSTTNNLNNNNNGNTNNTLAIKQDNSNTAGHKIEPHHLPAAPALIPGHGAPPNVAKIHGENQHLFNSLYNPNVSGIGISPIGRPNTFNHSFNPHKTWTGHQDTKTMRRGRPKKQPHSHRKAFEAGHPRFERALQQLIEMRQKHPQGLLPSIRGFMQTIHMGFANTNAVVKYYANNYLNMTLDDFKRDYMVIRRVRAKTRSSNGGRPKKIDTLNKETKNIKKYDGSSNDSETDSDHHMKNGMKPFKPLPPHQFNQQLLMRQLHGAAGRNGNHSTETIQSAPNMAFNLNGLPQFFNVQQQNFSIQDAKQEMPKLIADTKTHDNDIHMTDKHDIGVKLETIPKSSSLLQSDSNFEADSFITALESDLSVLMRLQDSNNRQNNVNAVSPEEIKKPLQVVRKRLLKMLDRKLYHQLNHTQKVTIAKANLIAGICTAAIHTGYCKDALALYRQSLTLFRELNGETDEEYQPSDHEDAKKDADPFILGLIENCKTNTADSGKYSMFIVVIYYQMSLLYDKSLIEKVQKSRYYLIQALNLLVRENAMNANKYCIETLQRLALFALETGKDDEYISMMCITLGILKKHNEKHSKILDVEIHFVKNLLGYGKQLGESPNLRTDPQGIQRFEAVKSEYQKLLMQIIENAKENHQVLNDETRRTLSRLLELARFLLTYQQLNESYKIYHCMRQMCDNTQINLDLDFMKVWICYVKDFIAAIVKQNTVNGIAGSNGSNANNKHNQNSSEQPIWNQQILELCEFDVKVLEKIKQSTDVDIGTNLYSEYVICANALHQVNFSKDKIIIARCQQYVQKALMTNDQQTKMQALALQQSLQQIMTQISQ